MLAGEFVASESEIGIRLRAGMGAVLPQRPAGQDSGKIGKCQEANELAKELGVPTNRITEIMRGRRGISADTALRLGRCFGTGQLPQTGREGCQEATEALPPGEIFEQLAQTERENRASSHP